MTLTFANLLILLSYLRALVGLPSTYPNLSAMTSLDNDVIASAPNGGSYTPTASATQAGVTVTPGVFRWIKAGGEVHVIGTIAVTTVGTAFTSVKLTLPFDGVLASQAVGGAFAVGAVDPGDAWHGWAVTLDTAALALVTGSMGTTLGPYVYKVSFAFTAA